MASPVATRPDSGRDRVPRTRRSKPIPLLLLLPGIIGLGISFIIPLLWVARMSLNEGGSAGAIIETITLRTYVEALTDGFTWEVTLNTLQLGALVTVITLVLAYPVALFLTRTTSRWRGLLLALAVAPLLTSQVVRTYGWMVILGNSGVVNESLLSMGLINSALPLANNFTGVIIALVEILMPYGILVMVAGFGRISQELEQAAGSLGANAWHRFWRVTFPLSLPAVFTAGLLVFVLAISSFVTPALLGGGRVFVLATEIYNQAMLTLNWPLAAALSMILLTIFSVLVALYLRTIRRFEF
ncbi:putative spermidine/putrescine transport system permease protein [Spinactinospora alkalitolerans]|uniref:Putative spermidine/putrescine transport system permease protein n=1 Tax=Spinactinospora alkalitolerans TaxID=687207 RepID=A0A852U7Q3_9ACTN|nr:ABC transporter permease [Spinactinospora alkalitolerans]NYE50094.1 putative spermidine/putrescine transport system permease protein [Spinactinospora alkalitolerans]